MILKFLGNPCNPEWHHCHFGDICTFRWVKMADTQMMKFHLMTSSNGNIFRVTGPLRGEPPVTDGFPSQRPVTRNFDISFDLRLHKYLSKQSRRRWFETPSRSLWRHCNSNHQSRGGNISVLWRHDMGTLSTILLLCVWDPVVCRKKASNPCLCCWWRYTNNWFR